MIDSRQTHERQLMLLSNVRGIIQGHLDTHLNDHGRKESAAAGRGLKDVRFDEVWSSTLSRAKEVGSTFTNVSLREHQLTPRDLKPAHELINQTAQIIMSHNTASPPTVALQTDAGLMERYLGSLQGKKRIPGRPYPGDIEASDK